MPTSFGHIQWSPPSTRHPPLPRMSLLSKWVWRHPLRQADGMALALSIFKERLQTCLCGIRSWLRTGKALMRQPPHRRLGDWEEVWCLAKGCSSPWSSVMNGRSAACLSSLDLRKEGVPPGRLARPGSSSIEWMALLQTTPCRHPPGHRPHANRGDGPVG